MKITEQACWSARDTDVQKCSTWLDHVCSDHVRHARSCHDDVCSLEARDRLVAALGDDEPRAQTDAAGRAVLSRTAPSDEGAEDPTGYNM